MKFSLDCFMIFFSFSKWKEGSWGQNADLMFASSSSQWQVQWGRPISFHCSRPCAMNCVHATKRWHARVSPKYCPLIFIMHGTSPGHNYLELPEFDRVLIIHRVLLNQPALMILNDSAIRCSRMQVFGSKLKPRN